MSVTEEKSEAYTDLVFGVCSVILNKDPGYSEEEIEIEFNQLEGPGQLRIQLRKANVTLLDILKNEKEKIKDLGGGKWTGLPYTDNLMAIKSTLDNKKPEVKRAEERKKAERDNWIGEQGRQIGTRQRCEVGIWIPPNQRSRNRSEPHRRDLMNPSMNRSFGDKKPERRNGEGTTMRGQPGFEIGVWTSPTQQLRILREQQGRDLMKPSLDRSFGDKKPERRNGKEEERTMTEHPTFEIGNWNSTSEQSKYGKEQPKSDFMKPSMNGTFGVKKPERRNVEEEGRTQGEQPGFEIGNWNPTDFMNLSMNGTGVKEPERRNAEEEGRTTREQPRCEMRNCAGTSEQSIYGSEQPRSDFMNPFMNRTFDKKKQEGRNAERKGNAKREPRLWMERNQAGRSEESREEQPRRGKMTYEQHTPRDRPYFQHDIRRTAAEMEKYPVIRRIVVLNDNAPTSSDSSTEQERTR